MRDDERGRVNEGGKRGVPRKGSRSNRGVSSGMCKSEREEKRIREKTS